MKVLMLTAALILSFNTISYAKKSSPNCDGDLCTIFEVAVAINNPNGKEIKKRVAKEYRLPNEDFPRVKYVEVVHKKKDKCSKQINIPKKIYRVINKVLASTVDENGEPVATLTPYQQTIMKMYVNFMNMTNNFTCDLTKKNKNKNKNKNKDD